MIFGLVQILLFQGLGERIAASPTPTAVFAVRTGILGALLIPLCVPWFKLI